MKRIDFAEIEIPIDEISAEKLLIGENNFKQWFDAIPCDKENLDIYTWDVIEQYIKKCVRFCVSEVNALKMEKKGVTRKIYLLKHNKEIKFLSGGYKNERKYEKKK